MIAAQTYWNQQSINVNSILAQTPNKFMVVVHRYIETQNAKYPP